MPISDANNLSTLTGFRNHCARRLGADAFASLDTTLQSYINDGQAFGMDRLEREGKWKFLEDEQEITTGFIVSSDVVQTPPYSVTADFVAGSASVTNFSGNLTTIGLKVDDILNVSEGGFYRMLSGTGTTGTLRTGFAGSDGTTTSCTLSRDRYNLATDTLYIKQVVEIETARVIPILSLEEWRAITGGDYTTGTPRYCMVPPVSSTTTEASTDMVLQLWPIPNAILSYRVVYQKAPTYTDTNVFAGPNNMELLVHATLVHVYEQRGDLEMAKWHENRYLRLLPNALRREVNKHRVKVRAIRTFGRARQVGRRPFYNDPLTE
jgi:hypothetical protein